MSSRPAAKQSSGSRKLKLRSREGVGRTCTGPQGCRTIACKHGILRHPSGTVYNIRPISSITKQHGDIVFQTVPVREMIFLVFKISPTPVG